MPNDSYSSGHALERAVSARARKGEGPSLEQYYVDRFIARISSYGTPSFVLKGGQALNMRMVHARHTRDIDFATLGIDLDDAVALITELAKRDLGDYLTYELAGKKPIAENVKGRSGYSLAFTPYTDWTRAHDNIQVDLVAEQTPSREFDVLLPERMMIRGLPLYDVYVTPVANAIADKVCATLERHSGHGSSRVRDLVDIVTYLLGSSLVGDVFMQRLSEQIEVRGLAPVREYRVPTNWLRDKGAAITYARGAREAHIEGAYRQIEGGLRLVKHCVDPALSGGVAGLQWSSSELSWMEC